MRPLRPALALALLVFGVGARPAQAQLTPADSARARPVTLAEAIRLAVEASPTLRRADAAVARQRVEIDAARTSRLPSVSFGTGGQQSYGRSIQEARIVNETTLGANAGVDVSATVYDGGLAREQARQARRTIEATGVQRAWSEQTIVYNVATSFVSVAAGRSTLALQRQALADQRETLARVEALIGGGVRPEADRYAQQAEVARAEAAVVSAERDVAVAEAQLAALLYLDPTEPVRFVVPELGEAALPAAAYDLDALVGRAFTTRADLRAAQAEIAVAEQGVRLARTGTRPRVSASFSYGTGWFSALQTPVFDDVTGQPTGEFRRVGFADQLDQRRGGSLGLNLSFPIFDRYSTRQGLQRARLGVDDARLALDERRQAAATQVQQAVLDARAAAAQVRATTAQVDAARRALTAAEDRYRFGTATIYDVAQARSALTSAEANLVQARTTLLLQDGVIRYYTGTLEPASLPLGN